MNDAGAPGATMTARLVDALYTEAMLLADETRGYFDMTGAADREQLSPTLRVEFACEALKATTRLMQVIGWLLVRKAVHAGEMPVAGGTGEQRRLGPAPALSAGVLIQMPEAARRLLVAGEDLYQRVKRLDEGIDAPAPSAPTSPVLTLMQRLESSI